jgi:hypothetical protein
LVGVGVALVAWKFWPPGGEAEKDDEQRGELDEGS